MGSAATSTKTDASNSRASDDLRAQLETLHPASFGWALLCCDRNADRAADVLQTAYVRALSGAATYRGHSNVKTWFFGVIRMVALEARRTGRPMEVLEEKAIVPERFTPPNAVRTHERAEAQHLIDAMNELPPRQREVLHLVFYEEMTLREAAELLDIRFGSASTHYDRGKKSLLERLRMRGVTR